MLSLPFQIWMGRQENVFESDARIVACEFFFQVPSGCGSFLSQEQLLPSGLSLFCILRTRQLSGPKIWPNRNVGCTPLEARVLLSIASSSGLSEASFLLVIFGSGSGSWESNVLCILFGDAACLQGVVKYRQEYLLFVPAETRQDIWRDFFFQ